MNKSNAHVMHYHFTPGAERALSAAARWWPSAPGSPEAGPAKTDTAASGSLEPPQVLLGLLAEPECRAALMLAPLGIDADTVRQRWPHRPTTVDPDNQQADERANQHTNPFSPALAAAIAAAEARLFEYPRPLVLATEHLLLGLAAAENEVAHWLRERGLDVDELEAEIHRLAGHRPGPLPLEGERPDLLPLESDTALGPGDIAAGLESASDLHAESPADRTRLLRVIDANANRAGEGLRVVEDYVRFALDDRHLTEICKSIRHDLRAALDALPGEERHAARDTAADVGAGVHTATGQARASAADVALASFKRVEQALRSLEEYTKVLHLAAAADFERLRYRTYELERAVDITRTSINRLANLRLYVLVDGRASTSAFSELVTSLAQAGVHAIQLRDKTLSDRELVQRARALRQLTHASGTLAIVNDRPDLAMLSGADGVHIGQTELSVKDARSVAGPAALVGVSTHSIAEARQAVLDGANYIGVGPTFPSGTKEFSKFTGTELLRQVNDEVRLPALAVGGITLENLPQVLATGIRRVAVQGAICGADNPAAAARKFLAALG